MRMPTVKPNIFDGETNRPMTDAEYAQWQTDNANAQAQTETEDEAAEAKAAARQALLTRLGITSDEAKLLLG